MSETHAIIECSEGSLPGHWSSLGELSDGRRVMKLFDSYQKAASYLNGNDKNMYGMYEKYAEVRPLDDLDVDI